MSSHKEAPEISHDPVADNTDLYAFVSPDKPDTVTIIANFNPLETPAGGPNFDDFGNDVLYQIHINNTGNANPDIVYQFNFNTQVQNPNTFLYNTGPIKSLDDPNWNVRQFYTITKVMGGQSTMLGSNLACPPCNVGVRSTPNYPDLANMAIHSLPSGETVFAGQRADLFFVDLGSIFDLGAIRPIQMLHLIPLANTPGVDAIRGHNVHSIIIQIPMTMLTASGSMPTDPMDSGSVIGIWASASRQTVHLKNSNGQAQSMAAGPFTQVSRLGNPLINEVVIPLGKKDFFNTQEPKNDAQFAQYGLHPELAMLLPVLYPTAFPHLQALANDPADAAARKDLAAILFTGIPSGIIPGFQNYTGSTIADMLRLNMAIGPTKNPNPFGILGMDLAGYPNGRRISDDVVSIELRAIAGATFPLIDKTFTPDAAATSLTGGVSESDNPAPELPNFPYLATALGGYEYLPPSSTNYYSSSSSSTSSSSSS